MVENAVETEGELVDVAIVENMCFRDRSVAPVIKDVLGAGEGVSLSKSGRAAGNKRNRLIVAEAGEESVLGREIVIDAGIPLALVEPSDWNTREVETQSRVAGVAYRIEIDHPLSDRINHVRRNLVAVYARSLRSIR